MMMGNLKYAVGVVVLVGVIACATEWKHARAQSENIRIIATQFERLDARQRVLERRLSDMGALLEASHKGLSATPRAFEVIQGLDTTVDASRMRGHAAAKFVFIEYSDFQCPFCARYTRDTARALVKEFVESGQMKYAFRHFPLKIHGLATKAAEAAECAGEESKFWEMHEKLLSDQRALAEVDLVRHAHSIGLDERRFESCLMGGVMAGRVSADVAEGMRLGIKATPTFFIGRIQSTGKVKLLRKISGAHPYATFKAALQGVLAIQPAVKQEGRALEIRGATRRSGR